MHISSSSSSSDSTPRTTGTSPDDSEQQQEAGINKDDEQQEGGTYRRFAEYAWTKLHHLDHLSLGLSESINPVPPSLKENSSPVKGGIHTPEGTMIKIELKSSSASVVQEEDGHAGRAAAGGPIRLARYALLETLTPRVRLGDEVDAVDGEEQKEKQEMISIPQAVQVLNLVIFPNTSLPLPVLGMDLVTLPGGKHLIAIDFQPTLPPPDHEQNDNDSENDTKEQTQTSGVLFGKEYQQYETTLQELHQKYVLDQREVMPWGGDIPPKAQRFFSKYALWTRLQDSKGDGDGGPPQQQSALSIIDQQVYQAFCAYFDFYLEMMLEVQEKRGDMNIDNSSKIDQGTDADADADAIRQGHVDYLNYRRLNDPARPMLTRLFGEEYTEQVISEVLFEMI